MSPAGKYTILRARQERERQAKDPPRTDGGPSTHAGPKGYWIKKHPYNKPGPTYQPRPCVVCGYLFKGRPNRRYCGYTCRRKMEKLRLRHRRREMQAWERYLRSMGEGWRPRTPWERLLWDLEREARRTVEREARMRARLTVAGDPQVAGEQAGPASTVAGVDAPARRRRG